MKQDQMPKLQNPNQSNADNLNNVRHKVDMQFRHKEKECLKAKTDDLETNSTIKNITNL
jgi:hypothetical protein